MGENTWKLLLLGVESLWLPLSGPFLSFAQILSEITFLTLYWLVSGIPAHRIVAQGLSFVAYMWKKQPCYCSHHWNHIASFPGSPHLGGKKPDIFYHVCDIKSRHDLITWGWIKQCSHTFISKLLQTSFGIDMALVCYLHCCSEWSMFVLAQCWQLGQYSMILAHNTQQISQFSYRSVSGAMSDTLII